MITHSFFVVSHCREVTLAMVEMNVDRVTDAWHGVGAGLLRLAASLLRLARLLRNDLDVVERRSRCVLGHLYFDRDPPPDCFAFQILSRALREMLATPFQTQRCMIRTQSPSSVQV